MLSASAPHMIAPSRSADCAWLVLTSRRRSGRANPYASRDAFQGDARRVRTGCAADAGATVHRRPAQIETFDRRSVLRKLWRGAHPQRLIERDLRVVRLAFGVTAPSFEIGRRKHLPLDDGAREPRHVRFEQAKRAVGEVRGGGIVPHALRERVRRVLHVHVDRPLVGAVRMRFDVRRFRNAPVFHAVRCTLEIIEPRRDGDAREIEAAIHGELHP
jgi:hypothetical protein